VAPFFAVRSVPSSPNASARVIALSLVPFLVACVWSAAAFAETAPKSRAPALRNRVFASPIPGGIVGGWAGDTGLDISANFRPVFAIGAGTLEYSEHGHTRCKTGKDTPNSVRLRLDTPVPFRDRDGQERAITHVFYTHLSSLVREVAEGAEATAKPHVEAGEQLGVSGIGNQVPHLHMGLLLDGHVDQDAWTWILDAGEVQRVLGGYKNGEVLP
jgi:hypothetical protein